MIRRLFSRSSKPSRRKLRSRPREGMLKLLLFVIGGVLLFQVVRAQTGSNALRAVSTLNDGVKRSIQELRAGGPVYPADSRAVQFNGTRWIADPSQKEASPIQRALEYVADIDGTGAGRERLIDSTIDKYRRAGVREDELFALQSYAKPGLITWDGTFEAPPADAPSARQSGQSQAATTDRTQMGSWAEFLASIQPTDTPMGRELLYLLGLHQQREQVASELDTALQTGALPEFANERIASASPPPRAPGSPPPNEDLIVKSSAQTGEDLKTVIKAPYDLALNLPYPHNPTALSDPSQQLPSILSGAEQQRSVESVAFGTEGDFNSGAGLGRVDELTGVAPPGAPLSESLVQRAVLQQAAQRVASAAQTRLTNVNTASSFFSPSASAAGNMFSSNDLLSRIGNLFSGGGGGAGSGGGSGGGGGGLPNNISGIPDQRPQPPAPSQCNPQQARITADEAKGVAVLLGLPPATSQTQPWAIAYAPTREVYGAVGIDTETGLLEEVTTEDFPQADGCLWVVTFTDPTTGSHLVLVEDVLSQTSRKIHLGTTQ